MQENTIESNKRKTSDDNRFTEGFICAVAALINMHGCEQEAVDLMNCISKSKKKLINKGCALSDIEVLESHNLLTD